MRRPLPELCGRSAWTWTFSRREPATGTLLRNRRSSDSIVVLIYITRVACKAVCRYGGRKPGIASAQRDTFTNTILCGTEKEK